MKSAYCPLGDLGANQQLSLIKKGEKGLEKRFFVFLKAKALSSVLTLNYMTKQSHLLETGPLIKPQILTVRLGFDTS